MPVKLSFPKNQQQDFYTTVNKKVEAFFSSAALSKKANGLMFFKVFFYSTVFIAAYLILIIANPSVPEQFLLWMVLGLFTAFIGLNIAHDAVHGSLSKYKSVNKVLGYSFNIIGGNCYVWNITHNIVHHTYTNIEGHDEDIALIPLLRMSPHQKLRKVHRYQHWYAFFFYSLSSLLWVFVKDYVKFFKKNIGNYNNKRHPRLQYFILFGSKAVYYILFLVIPLVFIHATWWQVLLGFVLLHLTEGLTMAIIFMLAHVVEETDFPLPDNTGNIKNTWAVHQLYTTANFGRNNALLNFLCGGLNFQVEHHLYPKICHVHYRRISAIVKETAESFNLRYNDNASFFSAIASHIRLLKALGRNTAVAEH
jgi:linoleoyl-CoA desaturase